MDQQEQEGVDDEQGAAGEVSYPYFGLKEAVEFAKLSQRTGGNSAREDAVMRAFGVTVRTNRRWAYSLSTAKEFGLIRRVGRKADARIELTPLAKRLLLPGSESEAAVSRMEAFRHPHIYKDLVKQFADGPLPDEVGLTNILVRDFGLLETVAPVAAKSFLESAVFAGIVVNGLLSAPHGRVEQPPIPTEELPTPASSKPAAPAPLSPPPVNGVEFIQHQFQLRKDLRVTVPLPIDLTNADVERLAKWMRTLPLDGGDGT